MITLTIQDDEIGALRVALIGLVQDATYGPVTERWRAQASAMFKRVEAAELLTEPERDR